MRKIFILVAFFLLLGINVRAVNSYSSPSADQGVSSDKSTKAICDTANGRKIILVYKDTKGGSSGTTYIFNTSGIAKAVGPGEEKQIYCNGGTVWL